MRMSKTTTGENSGRLEENHSPTNRPTDIAIPGLAAISGSTRAPAPIVFPVTINAVVITACTPAKSEGIVGNRTESFPETVFPTSKASIVNAFRDDDWSLILLVVVTKSSLLKA